VTLARWVAVLTPTKIPRAGSSGCPAVRPHRVTGRPYAVIFIVSGRRRRHV
jgi:hypothetical protein